MRKKILLIIMTIFIGVSVASAQKISGRIINEKSAPLAGTVVILLQLPDSTIVETTITDIKGFFSFQKEGDIIVASYIGYNTQVLEAIPDMSDISMSVNSLEISDVTVTVQSEVSKKGNNLVVSKAYLSPFATGKNAFEFMEFMPLLDVKDNEISLFGRGSAIIMINGRRTEMGVDMLKNISASDIESIEIIPTPGSSFRADEQNGAINIILRKSASKKLRGSVTLNDTHQNKHNSQNINTSLNYNSKKVYLTSGVRFAHYLSANEIQSTTSFYSSNNELNETKYSDSKQTGFVGFMNMDYNIDKRQTIGFNLNAVFVDEKDTNNTTTNYSALNSTIIDSTDFSLVDDHLPLGYRLTANIHYDLKIDDKGSLFSVDADYFHRDSKTNSNGTFNRQYDDESIITINNFMQSRSTLSNYYSLKSNYIHYFDKDNTLKTGVEVYASLNNNDYFYGNQKEGIYVNDPQKSNNFLHDEIVGSAYIEYLRRWNDKWESVIGARMETMHSKGELITTSEINKIEHIGIFPSLSLSYTPSNLHRLSLGINTGIGRPSFNLLNPFIMYESPNLYIQNNVDLKPAKSYGALLSYMFFKNYIFAVDYAYWKDNWTEFDILTEGDIIKRTTANYEHNHYLSFTLNANRSFFNNYLTLQAKILARYDNAKGKVETFIVDVSNWRFIGDISTNISLSKKSKWDLIVSYQYASAHTWVSKYYDGANRLTAGINKQFKNQSSLSFRVNKNLADTRQDIKQPDYLYTSYTSNYTDFSLTYKIQFGNKKVKAAKKRSSVKRME